MRILGYLLLLFINLTAGYAQTKKQMKTNEKDSIGHVEKFDFEYAEKIKKETGWNAVEYRVCVESCG